MANNCWGTNEETDDNVKVIRHFKDLVIDSKIIKKYFKENHKWQGFKGDDYYGISNWILDEKTKIFISDDSSRKRCYIDFICKIKTDKEFQQWYMEKFNSEFLQRKLVKKLEIKIIKKEKVNKI